MARPLFRIKYYKTKIKDNGFCKITDIIKDSPSFTALTDLAPKRFGEKVVYATDDFLAEKENLILPTRDIFIHDKYTDRRKWIDGWES